MAGAAFSTSCFSVLFLFILVLVHSVLDQLAPVRLDGGWRSLVLEGRSAYGMTPIILSAEEYLPGSRDLVRMSSWCVAVACFSTAMVTRPGSAGALTTSWMQPMLTR